MEYFYKCPECNDSSYTDIILSIGRLLECPYCKSVFPFSPDRLVGEGTKYGPVKYYSEKDLTKLLHITNKETIEATTIRASDSNQTKQEAIEPVKDNVEKVPAEEISSDATSIEVTDSKSNKPEPQEVVKDSVKQVPVEESSFSVASEDAVEKSRLECTNKIDIEIPKDKVLYDTIQYRIEPSDLQVSYLQATEITPQRDSLTLNDIIPSVKIPLHFEIAQDETTPIKTEMVPSSHEINPPCENHERK